MENIEDSNEGRKIKGLLYLPQHAESLALDDLLKEIDGEIRYYDPGKVDDENLNFKFLLPTADHAKESELDFVLGFDNALKRMIIGYLNGEGKFLVLNAHQQASLMVDHFFTTRNPGETKEKTVIKGNILSQQIDKIVIRNEGRYRESHVGYTHLKAALEKELEDKRIALACDDRNHILLDADPETNAKKCIAFVIEMVQRLIKRESSIYLQHVDMQIIYKLYGEKTFNISSEGQNKKVFDRFRLKAPSDSINEELVTISDYKKELFQNKLTGRKGPPELGPMDLVQLEFTSGLKISVELADGGSKLFLHLSDYIDCYNRASFPDARKNIHDRLLKVVVSLGKMVINLNN
jgi:phosphomannomutase